MLILVVGSLDQERETRGHAFLHHVDEGVSKWTTLIDGTFSLDVDLDPLGVDFVHSEGVCLSLHLLVDLSKDGLGAVQVALS